MHKFGLIGKHIDYSFSRIHFTEKFKNESLNCSYLNFDLDTINEFQDLINENKDLKGLNVTIPYKEEIIPFLDKLTKTATKIGAVNTIKFSKKGKLIGYNTDYYGFKKSIEPYIKKYHKKALILGTGGASKAIIYALESMHIEYALVSRTRSDRTTFIYAELDDHIISSHQIIINCTPLGTVPDINACPDIPYNAISRTHLLFDLVYNPPLTTFLKKGQLNGASICNGEKMLTYQAEESWRIWNK
jgi:shikimate dehydrogenase